MREYSAGSIRKKKKYDGSWEWQALINAHDGKERRQLTKMTGVPCSPASGTSRGRGEAPTGKGARQAAEVLKRWRDELVAAEAAAAPNPTRDTVSEFVEGYIATRDVEPGTRCGYRYLLKYLDALDMPLSDLDAQRVERWKLEMAKSGLGATMRNKAFNILKYACNWGVAIGALSANPCAVVKPPQRPKNHPNPLDPCELPRLVDALGVLRKNQPAFSDLCLLALNTGMRRGELCALTFADVDANALRVNRVIARGDGGSYVKDYPKNGHRRSIDLNDEIQAVIERRRGALSPFAGDLGPCYVFADEATPQRFPEPTYMTRQWHMFAAMNGFIGVEGKPLRLHDLRDTFATTALVNGVPVLTVAAILGHEDPHTTEIHYAHFIPSKNKEAMSLMGKLLNASPGSTPS